MNTSISCEDDMVALWTREESQSLVIIKDGQHYSNLKLNQFPSSHRDWGIFSQVWDGGLATLSYLLYSQSTFVGKWRSDMKQNPFLLLDLGAGTGVVGIGANLWMGTDDSDIINKEKGYSASGPHTWVTDIDDALPLLVNNCKLNNVCPECNLYKKPHRITSCEAVTFQWEENPEKDSFIQYMDRNLLDTKRLLIVGSDIIYRMNLFRPLLCSIKRIFDYSIQRQIEIKCIMGVQSIRTHLRDFYELAQGPDFGFRLEYVASVDVAPSSCVRDADNADQDFTIHLPTMEAIHEADTSRGDTIKLEDAPKRVGTVHIFEMSLI